MRSIAPRFQREPFCVPAPPASRRASVLLSRRTAAVPGPARPFPEGLNAPKACAEGLRHSRSFLPPSPHPFPCCAAAGAPAVRYNGGMTTTPTPTPTKRLSLRVDLDTYARLREFATNARASGIPRWQSAGYVNGYRKNWRL